MTNRQAIHAARERAEVEAYQRGCDDTTDLIYLALCRWCDEMLALDPTTTIAELRSRLTAAGADAP